MSKEKVDRLTYDTFDENQEREQISEVSYGADKTLQWVDSITIRKSTLRFQHTVEFYEENGGHSLVFTGNCYKIAHKTNTDGPELESTNPTSREVGFSDTGFLRSEGGRFPHSENPVSQALE